MQRFSNNLKNWSMGEFEIAKYSPISGDSNASNLQLYIPKLMPLISFGKPKVTPIPLDKSILENDDSCKPSVNSMIKTQNYRTVPRTNNRKFARIQFLQGAEIQIEVKDGDPDNLYVSTKIDNSTKDVVTETYKASTIKGKGTVTLLGVPFADGVRDASVSITGLEFKSEYSDQNLNPM